MTISALDCMPQGASIPTGDGAGNSCSSGTTRTTLGGLHPCTVRGRAAVVDTYVCNLDLPSGAILTEVLAYGNDSSATGFFEANLMRQAWPSFGTAFVPNVTWATTGAASAPGDAQLSVLAPPTTITIDTLTFRYMLVFAVQETTVSFHGFRVQYTLN